MLVLHRGQYLSRILAAFVALMLSAGAAQAQGLSLVWSLPTPSTGYVDQPYSGPFTVTVQSGGVTQTTGSGSEGRINLSIAAANVASGVTPTITYCGSCASTGNSGSTVWEYAQSGVAAFTGLTFSAAGTGYELLATEYTAGDYPSTSGTFSVESQTPIYAIYPPTAGEAGYGTFTTDIVPHIDGVVIAMMWDQVDTGTTGTGCQEATTCNWTNIDSEIEQYAALKNSLGKSLKVALLVWPAGDNGNALPDLLHQRDC